MATTNTAPILNDYKITFAKRRVVQVVLGGVVLFFSDSSFVPVSVYVLQVALFLLPLVVGLPLILVCDSFSHDWIPALIYGGVVGLFTFITKCISIRVQHNAAAQADAEHAGAGASASAGGASLSEEQEYHFEKLWSAEFFSFLFPVPAHSRFWLFSVLFQSLFCGCVCFGAFFYLLPSNLKLSYHEMPVILFEVIGWISFLTCLYSLVARPPPEPNQFRSHDTFGLGVYTRTFYLLVFFGVNLAYKWVPDSSTIEVLYYINKAFHVVFLCLPLVFTVGLLPQIEVLFGWALEQVHIFFLGGSATASNFRLCWLSIIGGANVAIVYSVYLAHDFLSPGLGAGLGFLLSSDIVSFSKKQIRSRNSIFPSNIPRARILRHSPLYNFMFAIIVGCAAGAISAYSDQILGTHKSLVRRVLDVALLVTLVSHVLCTQLQRPFLFSLFRNPLYSKIPNVLQYISFASSILGSIVMTMLLCWFAFTHTHSRTRIFLPRAFRWVWQSTPAALLEMAVVEWCVIYAFDSHDWDLQVLLFYAALVDDRLFQFLYKMHYVICSFISVLRVKKLRFPHYKFVVGLQIVFFPLVIATVLVSCALSAPILPFLGIPIFIIGFPRPLRVWQTSGKNYQQAKDSIYYKQLVPRLVGELAKSFGKGVMGWGRVGDMYLLRLESKLVWVHILERGNCYVSVLVKGLELQETSCHHAEAAKIDEIFERTIESEKPLLFNQYYLNTLLPLGKLPVLTYANNNMTLTGIIDHPDNLKMISEFFWKTLVFLLRKWKTPEKLAARQQQISKLVPMCRESVARFPTDWHNFLNSHHKNEPTPRQKNKTPRTPNPLPSPRTSSPRSSRPSTPRPSTPSKTALVATPSAWAHPSPLPPLPALSLTISPPTPPSPPYTTSSPADPLDDFLSEWSAIQKGTAWGGGGGGANRVEVPKFSETRSWSGLAEKREEKREENGAGEGLGWKSEMRESSSIELRPLRKTLDPIVERAPRDAFVDLVSICHCIVEMSGGYQDLFSGPRHVYDVYSGRLPSSVEAAFLESDEELRSMVLLAYKYAFKLVFDQSVLGEYENDTEILTQLEEYRKSWYFGIDTTDEWLENIEAETENLFSISVNEGVYSAHMLSLRKQVIARTCFRCANVLTMRKQVSKINGEGARAMWSSLNQELLFFTNDDDERYSIQAHPSLLRNITVQAAEPPLGYPVFGNLYDIPLL